MGVAGGVEDSGKGWVCECPVFPGRNRSGRGRSHLPPAFIQYTTLLFVL